MLAIFCIRLAFGLLASLLLIWRFPINPRFYRAHFLIVFALLVGAVVLRLPDGWDVSLSFLGAGVAVTLFGSVAWMLDAAPGGRGAMFLGTLCVGGCLGCLSAGRGESWGLLLLDDFLSAAFLGLATTAMLLGHSYLIAPTMSIKPLQRLLLWLGGLLVLRMVFALSRMWLWTEAASRVNLDNEVLLWLVARWLAGLLLVLVLGWMAWETTRIRSTQSATGILYVLVVCCFLGELSSLLLFQKTQFLL